MCPPGSARKPVWFCVTRPLLSCNFCDIPATTPPRHNFPGPDCLSGLAVQQDWVRNVFQGTVASRAGPPSGILPAHGRFTAHPLSHFRDFHTRHLRPRARAEKGPSAFALTPWRVLVSRRSLEILDTGSSTRDGGAPTLATTTGSVSHASVV